MPRSRSRALSQPIRSPCCASPQKNSAAISESFLAPVLLNLDFPFIPMKNHPFRFASLLCLTPVCALAGTASIKIDVDHVIDQVDPHIYGVFMEPIGFHRADLNFNTLYGPVYDPKSPLADEHGFRKDMIDAARELQLTNMRWPGGN